MRHRYIKIGVTAAVLVLAFSGLLWSTLRQDAQYFKHVDEIMTERSRWEGKQLQLHGYVVAKSILVRMQDTSPEYKFQVQHNGQTINATYKGTVPDTFKDTPGMEAEVVMRGRLTADGFHVEPNGIMAKCPSKYEEAKKVG